MSSLNDSVARSIRQRPAVFACRTDVLHNYFCTSGNGMEWACGALVTPLPLREPSLDDFLLNERQAVAEASRRKPLPDGASLRDFEELALRLAQERAQVRYENATLRFRYENADDLAKVTWDRRWLRHGKRNAFNPPQPISPLSRFSRLSSVPDDVQPDWLAGVREMIVEVFHSPAREDDSRFAAAYNRELWSENILHANKALSGLHARFGPHPGVPASYSEWRGMVQSAPDAEPAYG